MAGKTSIFVTDGKKHIHINSIVRVMGYIEWILYFTLTLLSRSNSFFSHSKSLYRRLTQDSFSLKIGRFVCKKTHITQQLLFKSFLQLYNTYSSTVQEYIFCVPWHKGSQSKYLPRAKYIHIIKNNFQVFLTMCPVRDKGRAKLSVSGIHRYC